MAPDRRRGLRFYLNMPVRLLVARSRSGVDVAMRDLSPGGCFLATDVRPAVEIGADVAVGFAQPDGTMGLAKGRVLRIEECGFAVVLETANAPFIDLINAAMSARVCGHA